MVEKRLKTPKIVSDFVELRKFLSYKELRPLYWLIPVFLSLLAAFFEGISLLFLIPLAKGIITMDFSFVRQLPLLKTIFTNLPQTASTPTAIFVLLVGIIFIAAVLKNILEYSAALSLSYRLRKFSNIIRQIIFNRYLSFGKMFFDRNNIGYLHTLLVHFTMFVANQLNGLQTMLNALFMLVVYLGMMFVISWRLTILVILIFPILNSASKWLIKKIKKTSEFYAASYEALSNNISNILQCIPLVKLYTIEESEKKHFSSLSTQIEKIGFSMDKKQNLINPMQEIIMLIAVMFLISAMAFMVVKEKRGDVAGFLIYFLLLKRSMGFFGALNNFKSYLATVSGPMKAIWKILDDKDKFFVIEGKEEFSGLKRSIDINRLNFSYLKGPQILKDVTFSIEKDKKIAIVGPTGAGKTTIINLILRFYDCPPSSIMIDGADIRVFTFKSLRAHMALVSQDALLFNDTLKNNIIYGLDRKISDEELIEIAKKAKLYDFISALPEGFNTSIGDRGIKLSGGEKQRLSIARALLKGAEILILDEATSSLDTQTEILIQEALNEAIQGKTVITIAHRLSTIRNVDKIVVIEYGRIIEEGSLEELLYKKGKFYEYWESQKFR